MIPSKIYMPFFFILMSLISTAQQSEDIFVSGVKINIVRTDVILEWQHQIEEVDTVVVEHSTNGKYFKALKTVSGSKWESTDHQDGLLNQPRQLYRLHFYRGQQDLGVSKTFIAELEDVFENPIALIDYESIKFQRGPDPDLQ